MQLDSVPNSLPKASPGWNSWGVGRLPGVRGARLKLVTLNPIQVGQVLNALVGVLLKLVGRVDGRLACVV